MIDEKILIERLEERRKNIKRAMDKFGPTTELVSMDGAFIHTIQDVNQLAEEQKEKLMLRNCVDGQEIEPYGRPRVYMGMEDLIELEAYRDFGTLHQIRVLNDRYHKLIETQRDNDWIPCSERLPSEKGKYLVTAKNETGWWILENNVFVCEYAFDTFIFQGWEDNEVIAWQPLPAPYKGEQK